MRGRGVAVTSTTRWESGANSESCVVVGKPWQLGRKGYGFRILQCMPERVLGESPSREETDRVRTVRKLPGETFLLRGESAISQHGGSYLDSNTSRQEEKL